MGYQLHLFFQMFDVASILAFTIAFVSVILLLEALVLKPLDKKSLGKNHRVKTIIVSQLCEQK